MPMSPTERLMARHALGLPNETRRSYRNHFAAPLGGPAEGRWDGMVDRKLAIKCPPTSPMQNLVGFGLTDEGALEALDVNESLDPEDFSDARYPVFVYGTLKRGHGNNRLLTEAKFLGAAVTLMRYRLIDQGVPFACRTGKDRRQVYGELYEVDYPTLQRLDRLESIGSEYGYQRTRTNVIAHTTLNAFIYTMQGMSENARPADIVDGWYVWRPDRAPEETAFHAQDAS